MATDEQLLKKIIFRDRQALEILVDRYYLLLWKVCQKVETNPLICERLITCVFQQLWNRPQEFVGKKRLLLILIICCKEKISKKEMNKKSRFPEDESDFNGN